MRAVTVSFGGLALTALAQLGVVLASGSVALAADTVHNAADALTAIPPWIAFRLGRRPPDRRHTYGYGRSEDLAGILVVVAIAAPWAFTVSESLRRLAEPRALDHPGWVVAAGLVGAVGNEAVAAYRIRVGRRIGSAALVADGLHARSDGLTSLARVLSDVPGVEAVDAVRVRWVGHELWAEAEIVSDADLPLAAAHAIAEEAHHRLLHEVPRLARATIHTNPCGHAGVDHHRPTAHHFATPGGGEARPDEPREQPTG